MNMALTVIQVLLSLCLIAIVMLQSGKSAGLSGAIAGAADTFLSKNKAKSMDAKLAKATKWVAIVWVVLTVVLCVHHKSAHKAFLTQYAPCLRAGRFSVSGIRTCIHKRGMLDGRRIFPPDKAL